MRQEWIHKQHGKEHVMYPGLLDKVHEQGLKRIETELIQIPSDQNGHVAIVRATVETEKGVFSDYGDASPKNVNSMIAAHLIRMASTRAKGRAMRDAVNIGEAMYEELGGDSDDEAPNQQPMRERFDRQAEPERKFDPAKMQGEASDKQKGMIVRLARQQGITDRDLDDLLRVRFGAPLAQLGKGSAAELIDEWMGEQKAATPRPAPVNVNEETGEVVDQEYALPPGADPELAQEWAFACREAAEVGLGIPTIDGGGKNVNQQVQGAITYMKNTARRRKAEQAQVAGVRR